MSFDPRIHAVPRERSMVVRAPVRDRNRSLIRTGVKPDRLSVVDDDDLRTEPPRGRRHLLRWGP
jgi:hypothetical protein